MPKSLSRRSLFGVLGGVAFAPFLPTLVTEPVAEYRGNPLRVMRADGKACVFGVAAETVYAGDLVQIQVEGATTVRVRS